MAKKPTSNEKNHDKIPYKDWVWVIDNLTKEQMTLHDATPPNAENIIDGLHGLLEAGFKITLKEDSYNKCWQCNAVCDETGYRNSGLAISARSDDTEDALSILMYKYFVVAEGDLTAFADAAPRGVRG